VLCIREVVLISSVPIHAWRPGGLPDLQDEVTGVFSMKPNEKNIRDLDFEIKVDSVSETNGYKMR
jgi:hypothetical protein